MVISASNEDTVEEAMILQNGLLPSSGELMSMLRKVFDAKRMDQSRMTDDIDKIFVDLFQFILVTKGVVDGAIAKRMSTGADAFIMASVPTVLDQKAMVRRVRDEDGMCQLVAWCVRQLSAANIPVQSAAVDTITRWEIARIELPWLRPVSTGPADQPPAPPVELLARSSIMTKALAHCRTKANLARASSFAQAAPTDADVMDAD
jgi:hypothetical protein